MSKVTVVSTRVKLPAYKAGLQKRLTVLLTAQPIFPPLVKGGEGRFVEV
jgi:hypothetical protein